jgi:hypothetical protein
MSRLRKNIGKQFHLQYLKKIKYLEINLTKDINDPLQGELQTTEKKN